MRRQITMLVSLLTAVLVIALMARVLPPGAAAIMLDINRSSWPFTVQNVLWLAFFVGLARIVLFFHRVVLYVAGAPYWPAPARLGDLWLTPIVLR